MGMGLERGIEKAKRPVFQKNLKSYSFTLTDFRPSYASPLSKCSPPSPSSPLPALYASSPSRNSTGQYLGGQVLSNKAPMAFLPATLLTLNTIADISPSHILPIEPCIRSWRDAEIKVALIQ